ncbi:TOMM system kinase/cyclase fusion protein [Desulfobacterota bacterium AH_259_B03_O07]|nr:TOMM system kinase/cyclase fusion protein [Desulfobacterota bacterium AH_259_B03_O07]
MQCTSCGFENPEGMKYCVKCATPLSQLCAECGFINPPESDFCGQCATSLTKKQKEKGKLQDPSQVKPEAPEGERRQLTVMFCDLVGSTALSEKLDPEELRDVVRNYQEVCANVVGRYDGHIAKYLGDGILVYFGYPMAHEDDAQRAVRSGLEIVGDVQQLNARSKQVGAIRELALKVRIGIHTGLVVVGEMGAGDVREKTAVVGETPNVAARLQEQAETNSVVVSSTTHRLIQGFFDCRELGPHTLKGFSQPLDIYLVLKETDVKSRLDVAITKGLTPLVGREQEVKLLLERWEQVKEGMGQVVFVSGEAGIGKSRLLQVLKERLAQEPHTRIENRCSSYYQNSSLYPVIDHFHRLLGFTRGDSPKEKLGKLEEVLRKYGFPHEEMVPIFATLLSLPIPDRYPPLNLTPQRLKQKTFEALLSWLLKEADQNPVLRIVEDLHWVDPSTLEYLGLLIEQVPTVRMFTILTFRPDFNPPWVMRSHLSQINLNRLGRKQVQKMIDRISGGKALPDEVLQQVAAKTDGIPLFVEELTKTVLESDLLREENGKYKLKGSLPSLAIPTTLHDSLMARLDRLVTVKEVAQLAATLGREFTYDLLRAVSPLDEQDLQRELAKLVEAELLYQRGLPPQTRYFFKHALIQEAAYESLLKSKRQQYHHKIARVMEEQFPETSETQPELLAHHFTEAGHLNQAIPYWHQAGQRATERSAHVEAIGHLTKGLELIKDLPDTPERGEQEFTLQTGIGVALMITKGWATPEVENAYARALELSQQVGTTPQLFHVLWGLFAYKFLRTEFQTALELGEQCLHSARDQGDSAPLVVAGLMLGMPLFHTGEFNLCQNHLNRSLKLYDPQQHHSQAFFIGFDPGVACRSYTAHTLWVLGYPGQALKESHETLTMVKELSHPFSLAYALDYSAMLHQFRREPNAAQSQAEAAIVLCSDHGFEYYSAWATIIQGWALAEKGEMEKGIDQMNQGLANLRDTGAELRRPYYLALVAEATSKAGQVEQGVKHLTKAFSATKENGERWWEAELYRLRGKLLLKLNGNEPEIEENFRKAIEIASKQGAKSLELRAVMSLSRLLQNQGKKEQAKKMLEEIYGRFTEGFDTKDLKDAKALIEKLYIEHISDS